MLVNGLAEKMSRVGCIINPRSVPRRTNLSGTLFGVMYNFLREILSVRHQANGFLRPRISDGQV